MGKAIRYAHRLLEADSELRSGISPKRTPCLLEPFYAGLSAETKGGQRESPIGCPETTEQRSCHGTLSEEY